MTPQEQEIAKMRDTITDELRAVFESNMKIFDWDIPENDERTSAERIIEVMEEALEVLKHEIAQGRYGS
jgi:hypothetical protein